MADADVQYVLERIESMLRLLATRTDSESRQAIVELTVFQSGVEELLSGESTPGAEAIETALCQLVYTDRTLALAFVDAMEADVKRLN